jgi:hypothetical protein
LFGAPAAEKPAATPEKPADKPAVTPPAAESQPAAGGDLFGAPAAEKAAPAEKPAAPAEKPADKPAGDKKDEKKADDIFGSSSSVLHEAGGLASNEMRQWVDNTGNFSCEARLIRLVDGQAQLLKDNGHTTTVPLARLSANDLRFVERQASAQHATTLQTAQTTSGMPWMTN